MTEVGWRTPGCKTCQDIRYHKGWHSAECYERVFLPTVPHTMWPVASTKRLLDTGADDARDDHESKQTQTSDDTVPMAQESSSGSGVKRSNVEAIRRADAEAEKALKRAKLLEEQRNEHLQRRWKLEEFATNAKVTDESLVIAAETVLTETSETQQVHKMNHRPETTKKFLPSSQGHDSDVQGASSSESARSPGEHESLRRGVRGRVARCDTRHVLPLGGHDENLDNVEIQVHCERLWRTPQRWRLLCSYSNNTRHPYNFGKRSRQTWSDTRSFCDGLLSQRWSPWRRPASCTHNHLRAATRRFWRMADVLFGECVMSCWVSRHLSPRRWQEHLFVKLKEYDFVQNERDVCLWSMNWKFAFVCLWTTCWRFVPVNWQKKICCKNFRNPNNAFGHRDWQISKVPWSFSVSHTKKLHVWSLEWLRDKVVQRFWF